VDETKRLAAERRRATRWISAICDVARRIVIDVIKGRGGRELEAWLEEEPRAWKDAVTATVTDLHEPFRQALAMHLRNATAVADPFQVIATGDRVMGPHPPPRPASHPRPSGPQARAALPHPQAARARRRAPE
jgi:transposase